MPLDAAVAMLLSMISVLIAPFGFVMIPFIARLLGPTRRQNKELAQAGEADTAA